MKWLVAFLLLVGCNGADYFDIGHEYLGARYVADPLGENMAPDMDPLIRDDAFDCVTFVETVLAHGNVNKLNKIRYKNGKIDFLCRNHFIESDWLINNSNLVENVSSKYGAVKVRHVAIDKQQWLYKVHGINAIFPIETVNLEYIPYDKLERINVSEPLIVLFIAGKSEKNDKIGTDLAVRHMGFLLPNGILRHASSQYGRVMDTDFYNYVSERAKDDNNIGITLVRIK